MAVIYHNLAEQKSFKILFIIVKWTCTFFSMPSWASPSPKGKVQHYFMTNSRWEKQVGHVWYDMHIYRFIAILVLFPIKNRPLVPEFRDHKYLTHTIQTSSVFGFKAIKRFMHYLSHPFTLSRFLMHSISKSTFHKRASIKDALRRLHFGEGVHFNKGTFLSIFYKF